MVFVSAEAVSPHYFNIFLNKCLTVEFVVKTTLLMMLYKNPPIRELKASRTH